MLKFSCDCPKSCNRIEYSYELTGSETFVFEQPSDPENPFLFYRNITAKNFHPVYEGLLAEYIRDENNIFFDEAVSFFKFEPTDNGIFNDVRGGCKSYAITMHN